MTDIDQAGVMIAKRIGAHTFVTIDSESQHHDIVQKLSLPVDRVFDQKSKFLGQRLERTAGPRAISCCLLTGRYRPSIEGESWLAPFGSVLVVSKSGFERSKPNSPYSQLPHNVNWLEFSLYDLSSIVRRNLVAHLEKSWL